MQQLLQIKVHTSLRSISFKTSYNKAGRQCSTNDTILFTNYLI